MSDRLHLSRREKAFNPATKRLVEYGLAGLVIGALLIAGLQVRPQNVLPSTGTLEVSITGDPPTILCSGSSPKAELVSLVVTVSLVQVHTVGALGLTGDWHNLTKSAPPIDLVRVSNVTQLLASVNLPEGAINIVRLEGISVTASTSSGSVRVVVSSDHLDAQVATEVVGGMKTSVFMHVVDPHIVCEGNGTFRLTPELTATTRGPG